MKIESNLFLALLGDYYIHTNTLKNQNIFTNNKVSLTIEQKMSEISDSIIGNLLFFNSKNRPIMCYYELNNTDELVFKDMYNNEIEVGSYISPFDEKIYSDKNILIQQAQTNRVNKRIMYYFKDKTSTLLLDQSLNTLTSSDITNAIIQKLVSLSPENYKTMQYIISILLGAPICLSTDGETIQDIQSDKIITDKNIYQIDENSINRAVGDKVNYLEPVYFLCKARPENISLNTMYIKILKNKQQDPFYSQQLINSMYGAYIYIYIPIDIFVEHNDIVKKINTVNTKFKIISMDVSTSVEEDIQYNLNEEFTIYKIDKGLFEAVERYSFTTQYYYTSTLANTFEIPKKVIKTSQTPEAIETDKLAALKVDYSLIDSYSKNKNIEYLYSIEGFSTNGIPSSKLTKIKIIDTKTESLEKKYLFDTLNIFKDKETTKIVTDITYEIDTTKEITLTSYHIDKVTTQNDTLKYILEKQEDVELLEIKAEVGKLSLTEAGYRINDKGLKQYVEDINLIGNEEKLSISSIDKSKIKIYNNNKLSTKQVSFSLTTLADSQAITSLKKEIIETRDSMLVDSNTNIDKE